MDIKEYTQADIEKTQRHALEVLQHYVAVQTDDTKSKQDLAEAGAEYIRAVAKVVETQHYYINQLIAEGQVLADALQGRPLPPKC